jgi:hypothetical protein
MWRDGGHSRVLIEPVWRDAMRMKLPASLIILVSLIDLAATPSEARTATRAERAACEAKIQRKIDAIDSRMRAPYGAEDGERLRERRRKLEEQRARCRTKN